MNDPWWLVLIKVVTLFVVLLVWTIFNVWYERRLVGKMQHRLGPIMNGPFGLLQAVADGMKLLIKEDFMPSKVDRVLFTMAPLIAGTAAFTAWAMIPFGGEVEIFGVQTRLQLADLPVGTLVILAVASVGIYGFVLAGWSSNSPYSLLGATAVQRADDLLRGRDGPVPGRGIPLLRVDVDLRHRRGPGAPAGTRSESTSASSSGTG